MSQSEAGAYIRLLCYQWEHGSIPTEPRFIKRIAGGGVSDRVFRKFTTASADGLLRNERMEKERKRQVEFREKQRAKGIKSGVTRRTTVEPRLNHGSIPVAVRLEPEGNSLSLSLSSSLEKKKEIQKKEEVLGPVTVFLTALGELYGRAPGQQAGYDELQHAVNIIHRTGWEQELDAIRTWFKGMKPEDHKFRPHTMRTLLENWQPNVDRANTHKAITKVSRWGVRGIL